MVYALESLPTPSPSSRQVAGSVPRVSCLALRAVAGSLSWVKRQCRPDEAGTASILQGSVSRAVVKDLSDANRAVIQLKQTKDVRLLIHEIPVG